MCALWSKNSVAVNKSLGGMSLIHPEFTFSGPYGTIPTINASRGGKLIKGSKAAKQYMKLLRSLRGKSGKRTRKTSTRKLSGAGLEEIVNHVATTLGGQGMAVLEKIAERVGTSVTGLFKDPDTLIATLQRVAPKIGEFIKKVFNFFRGRSKAKKQQTATQERMEWLKENYPQL